MKWGKMVAVDDVDVNNIYFVQIEVQVEISNLTFCSQGWFEK